jgi:hypothetical protein
MSKLIMRHVLVKGMRLGVPSYLSPRHGRKVPNGEKISLTKPISSPLPPLFTQSHTPQSYRLVKHRRDKRDVTTVSSNGGSEEISMPEGDGVSKVSLIEKVYINDLSDIEKDF